MTPNELLEETIAYYANHPRGTQSVSPDENACQYRTMDGAMCAVGRCLDWDNMPEEDAAWMSANSPTVLSLHDKVSPSGVRGLGALKGKYKDIPRQVWSHMQRLHDRTDHWEPNPANPLGNVLTADGLAWLRELRLLHYYYPLPTA